MDVNLGLSSLGGIGSHSAAPPSLVGGPASLQQSPVGQMGMQSAPGQHQAPGPQQPQARSPGLNPAQQALPSDLQDNLNSLSQDQLVNVLQDLQHRIGGHQPASYTPDFYTPVPAPNYAYEQQVPQYPQRTSPPPQMPDMHQHMMMGPQGNGYGQATRGGYFPYFDQGPQPGFESGV
eukprot:NODE_6648_length_627_cov_25.652000_g6625_i0.p1 GENE.NODE_6648_length_627_cov_25.652000_g6625_i0~~NODE_6648_length_627_cov_25.652000_g6625_i0.p1  ORF type:complete len:200 (+),score=37.32 NODE_6648_length_627_cov_25.652000_g6625_i0:72-602(+)